MSIKDYIEARVTYEPNSGCWIWLNHLDKDGYGVGFDNSDRKNKRAHRMSYEAWKAPIPEGLHIDHLCRVRCCVNPDHLEPVTCAENIRRGNTGPVPQDFCKRGHDMSVSRETRKNGQTYCGICAREQAASKYVKRPRFPESRATKMTREKVASIRSDYASGMSDRQIADKYGISRGYTWRVVTGRAWKI